MKNSYKTASCIIFLSLLVSSQAIGAEPAEVDFSCMQEQVRPIIQVTDQHQEFDLIVRNRCPGKVYWSMCIERMDPWTHKVLETHTPTGHVDVDKRGRVNLQMKATPDADGEINRSQEFYISVAYGIKGPAKASCVARSCEAQKTGLRAEASRNSKAWRNARKALDAKIVAECPDHGWNTDDTDACRQAIADEAAEAMAEFQATDQELRDRMAAIDPETCQLYGGNVIELKKP